MESELYHEVMVLSKDAAHGALHTLFRRNRVAELGPLFEALGTRSRMTVFRRLCEVDYLTSYTHGGRYYTLRDIPEFDEHGLWMCRAIGFSRFGNLKATTVELVEAGSAGRTHDELQGLLRVRVHNTLDPDRGQGAADRRRSPNSATQNCRPTFTHDLGNRKLTP